LKLLLDTHVWVWSLMDPERLAGPVKKALRASDSELWLSPMSTWEFLILVERGRIELEGKVDDWLAEAGRRAPMNEAPVTHEIARESRLVDLPNQDPVDRFLAATARVLELTLITGDERLVRSRACRVLANE
jgi:PIN domain nuclease of toxin-antitoxin system